MRTWFVTGASRGLGVEIVRQALGRGEQVVATARDPGQVERAFTGAGPALLAVQLDVTDEGQARAAVRAALAEFGRIDVLVNNAGRGLLGAVEEASDVEARAVFDTNVFGLLNVVRAALPVLRRQRSGHVINLSSVGGFAASAGWGVYNGTKFAVEGLSEAMRVELAPLGVAVTVVEPGSFRTDFLDGSSLHATATVIEDYAATVAAVRDRAASANRAQPGDPAKAAAAIVDLGQLADPPLRLQLGADCVARVEAKLASVAGELDAWRHIALATDYQDSAQQS